MATYYSRYHDRFRALVARILAPHTRIHRFHTSVSLSENRSYFSHRKYSRLVEAVMLLSFYCPYICYLHHHHHHCYARKALSTFGTRCAKCPHSCKLSSRQKCSTEVRTFLRRRVPRTQPTPHDTTPKFDRESRTPLHIQVTTQSLVSVHTI